MSRPLPIFPRGPRGIKRKSPQVLLACPRVSPQWELSVLTALMKPKPITRDAVRHRTGDQILTAGEVDDLVATARLAANRLGLPLHVQPADDGDYYLLCDVPPELEPRVRGVAVALSARAPGTWFVLGKLFVRDSVFHRRRRGYQLGLVVASDVHLPRGVRQLIRGLP